MSKETDATIQASDLPVVQYLNQRITFDLLATLEDGFSYLTTIESQSADSSSAKSSIRGGVQGGINFLGISLGGGMSESEEDSQHETTRMQLVHTPSSLFARLRNELHSKGLVHKVLDANSLKDISNGHFIEFEATLHRIQIIEILKAFELFASWGDLVDESPTTTSNRGRNKQRKNNQQSNTMLKQVKAIRTAISGEGSQDLVAKVSGMSFILTVEDSCFIDRTMNDVLDGTFQVFGKVTRVLNDETESINVFRTSPLGKFADMSEVFGLAMSSAMSEVKFEGGVSDAKILGPALQVIPIGIFA